MRDELIAKLEARSGPDGEPLGTKVLKPQDVYPEVRGVAPDLIVYFGDLAWRSVGSVGNRSIYTYENDTGPDGANHDRDGVFVMAGLPGQPTGEVEGPEPRRRRPIDPVALRHRGAARAPLEGASCDRTHPNRRASPSGSPVCRARASPPSPRCCSTSSRRAGLKTEILDGDVVRQNLSKGLGF